MYLELLPLEIYCRNNDTNQMNNSKIVLKTYFGIISLTTKRCFLNTSNQKVSDNIYSTSILADAITNIETYLQYKEK